MEATPNPTAQDVLATAGGEASAGAPTETAVTEAPPAATKPEPSASTKFDALARRERQLAKERQALKAEREEIERSRQEYKQFQDLKSKARENPDEYLAQAGMTYDDYVSWKLNGGKPTPELEMRGEVQSVKSEIERFKEEQRKSAEDQAKQQEARVQEQLEEFKSECMEFVEADPENYELTLLFESQHLVSETIQAHWAQAVSQYEEAIENGQAPKKPKVMSKKEAADLVEKYLEGQVDKTTKTKKWASKWGAQKGDAEPGLPPGPSKTLTNQVASTSATTTVKSEADAFKRALARLG